MNSLRSAREVVKQGETFGRLTVIGKPFYCRVGSALKRMQHVVCACECGCVIAARSSILKIGRLLSCGCYHSDELTERNTTHGFARRGVKKPYDHWCHMRERCLNPKHNKYDRYGGRGISICNEWKDSPREFCEWALRNGWQPGLQLDRIDNNGDYSPNNCRFVTHAENQRNRGY